MEPIYIDELLASDCSALFRNIDHIGRQHDETRQTFAALCNALGDFMLLYGMNRTNSPENGNYFLKAMEKLTAHAYDALLHEPEYFSELMRILANTTRTSPPFREHFGKLVCDLRSQVEEPDCILDIARRVITLKYAVTSQAIAEATRLIGNCCAYNGFNQTMFVHRDGIEALMRLTLHNGPLAVIIPAIYNVSICYREPLTISETHVEAIAGTESPRITHDLQEEEDDDDGDKIALPVERLAAVFRSSGQCASFELLLMLHERLSIDRWEYLALVIEMATRPALQSLEQVRRTDGQDHPSWSWSFSFDKRSFKTIELAVAIAQADLDCCAAIGRAMLNLLSQSKARDALLLLEDDSIWALMTMACHGDDDYDPIILNEDDEVVKELALLRRAFYKTLYDVTSHPAFGQNKAAATAMIANCTKALYSSRSTDSSEIPWQPIRQPLSNRMYLRASACVILAQLGNVDEARSELLSHKEFIDTLILLLEFERERDILYPATSIISRLALTEEQDPHFIQAGAIQKMQRLLTGRGLGLAVPRETVTAYRWIVHRRPNCLVTMLKPGLEGESVLQDVLTLWGFVLEDDIYLEICKLFIEVFNTMMPYHNRSSSIEESSGISAETTPTDTPSSQSRDHELIEMFNTFLDTSATKIAESYVWMCLKSEPESQRIRSWFAFAGLALWPGGRMGIMEVLTRREDFREAVLKASEVREGPVRQNLGTLLTLLKESHSSSPEAEEKDEGRAFGDLPDLVLQEAMKNMNLSWN